MNKLANAIKQTPIKALLFDLDDTLYESKAIYDRGLSNAWETSKSCLQFSTLTFLDFKKLYEEARRKTKVLLNSSPSKNSRLIYFQFLVQAHLGKPHAHLIHALDAAYSSAYQTIDFAPAQSVLKALRASYRIGIITNQTLQAQIEKLKVLDPHGSLIDYFIASETVGVEKPSLRIFDEALVQLNLPPESVLMIGDDLKNDIHGAAAAKIHSVLIDKNLNSDSILTQESPIIGAISSLGQLVQILSH